MNNLISASQALAQSNIDLPFSVYSSIQEQRILNVPIVKPMFIAVLAGCKQLGKLGDVVCQPGEFVFLSDNPDINMRNIPKNNAYYAILIEFDFEDFEGLPLQSGIDQNICTGPISKELKLCLDQFVEWSKNSPPEMWRLRKKEIIQLLYHMGYTQIPTIASPKKVSQKVFSIFSKKPSAEISSSSICDSLAMSESTLRRKLKAEGTSLQDIKDQTRMGFGLHLLQTTKKSISIIAQECGYQSQSRFTSRFKDRFGLTPSELRKTKLTD